ncbi:hypothetical protein VKT23_003106 [Stygiomarasmius scandens]|uniref:Uncharacterized protein n=1 Tax=Marasmiellus scandens TaxID=2682957 RepID=A0ABR1K2K0_9AGAR
MHSFQVWSWIIFCLPSISAVLVNRTIDDTLPDSTGASITYLPDGAWNDGTSCRRCTAKPDSGQMSSGTWHDGTFNSKPGSNGFPNQVLNASTIFNGTSVYVFCALSRPKASPSGNSDMTFYIDGQLVGTFSKLAPGGDGFDYNVPVYVNESLSPGFHKLVLQNGHVNGPSSLVILDRMVYSFDNGTETGSSATASPTGGPSSQSGSSPSNTGLIVGSVVAVSVVATLLGVCFLMRRRRLRNIVQGLLPPVPSLNMESSLIITPYPQTVQNSYPDANKGNCTNPHIMFNSLSPKSGSSARYPETQLPPSAPTSSTSNATNIRTLAGSLPPAYDFTNAANAPTLRLNH